MASIGILCTSSPFRSGLAALTPEDGIELEVRVSDAERQGETFVAAESADSVFELVGGAAVKPWLPARGRVRKLRPRDFTLTAAFE
eukprot:IDg7312t1